MTENTDQQIQVVWAPGSYGSSNEKVLKNMDRRSPVRAKLESGGAYASVMLSPQEASELEWALASFLADRVYTKSEVKFAEDIIDQLSKNVGSVDVNNLNEVFQFDPGGDDPSALMNYKINVATMLGDQGYKIKASSIPDDIAMGAMNNNVTEKQFIQNLLNVELKEAYDANIDSFERQDMKKVDIEEAITADEFKKSASEEKEEHNLSQADANAVAAAHYASGGDKYYKKLHKYVENESTLHEMFGMRKDESWMGNTARALALTAAVGAGGMPNNAAAAEPTTATPTTMQQSVDYSKIKTQWMQKAAQKQKLSQAQVDAIAQWKAGGDGERQVFNHMMNKAANGDFSGPEQASPGEAADMRAIFDKSTPAPQRAAVDQRRLQPPPGTAYDEKSFRSEMDKEAGDFKKSMDSEAGDWQKEIDNLRKEGRETQMHRVFRIRS
jgi:hypothetical protein